MPNAHFNRKRCHECIPIWKRQEARRKYKNLGEEKLKRYREYSRQSRLRDPEKAKQATRNWYINNPASRMLKSAKIRARKNGLEFDLTLDDIVVPEVCPVLGLQIVTDTTPKTKDQAPSLDRIDNTKGYVRGNIIVVSLKSNRIKSDATIEELQAIVDFYRGLQ